MQIKKSKKASLEDKKFTYVLIGFVFVLSICFVALEWTERDVTVYDVADTEILFEEEIEIQQTSQETPPPPPPPEVKNVEELIVVEDEKEVESVEIQTEDNEEEIIIQAPVEEIVEEEVEDVIFVVVETMPEFPGGSAALFKYLGDNLKYPVIAQENGIQGTVTCQFTVNKDGSIVDVVAVRNSSGDPSLEKEAIRVVKSMPKWNPGKQRGQAVRVKYTLPVKFRLQ